MGGGILWGCLIQALSSLGGAIPAKGRQPALRPDCGQATGDAVTEALAVTGSHTRPRAAGWLTGSAHLLQ